MNDFISKKIAPRGELRVGLNMSNFLLVNSKDANGLPDGVSPVSYTHLRAHET